MASVLNIHHIEPVSYVNGPGKRAVIWLQGCSLGCDGCYNPAAQPFVGGQYLTYFEILSRMNYDKMLIEGITISGGEPMLQIEPLNRFLSLLKENEGLSVLLHTGFSQAELMAMAKFPKLKEKIDVLIAGRYVAGNTKGKLFSAKKEIFFYTSRYTPADLAYPNQSEVIIKADGSLISSGLDPFLPGLEL